MNAADAAHDVVGALADNHYRHRGRCRGAGVEGMVCECGTTRSVRCAACGDPLIVAVVPGPLCRHAEEILSWMGT